MNELERSLRALEVDWPETPDLAAAVATRIAGEPAPARRRWRGRATSAGAPTRRFSLDGWRRRAAYALAAVALLFGGTMAVSPAARTDVLRWLGLESVEIKRGRPHPGATLKLGTPSTVDKRRRAGLPVRVPKGLREPDAYETALPDGTKAASLVYPGPILVQTFSKASVKPFIEKTVASADAVQAVRVDGKPGYFITGAHGFAYQRGDGFNYEDQRIAGNTLLVEGDGVLLRIEGALSRDRALGIARSVQ
jgi:hypothetical protein